MLINNESSQSNSKNLELEKGRSREQRIIAKTINFSIIYGKIAFEYLKNWNNFKRSYRLYQQIEAEQYPRVKDFEDQY